MYAKFLFAPFIASSLHAYSSYNIERVAIGIG